MAMSHGDDGAVAGGGALTAISAAIAAEEAKLTATMVEKAHLIIVRIIRPSFSACPRTTLSQTGYRQTYPRGAQVLP
jgi:hypothetical protein